MGFIKQGRDKLRWF